MIHFLKKAEYLGEFRFFLCFNTGEETEVDLKKSLTNAPGKYGEIFRNDPDAVKDFYLDPWPTIAWKCGYDISPENLYELAVEKQQLQACEDSPEFTPSKK